MVVIVWGLAYCSMIKLRIKEPNLPRPYRSKFYPWSSYLLILATLALLMGFVFSDTQNFIIIVIITLISYPVFLFIKRRKKRD
jgi:APA family basic amino acid/polyamine antiporter